MAKVNGARTIKLRELVKSVKILATGTQFQGNSPNNITLKAQAYGFTPVSYSWYKGAGTAVVGTNQNFIIANNQISTVETYKVVVKNNQNQEFEDTISISKVLNGSQGIPGQIPVQREWKTGDVYRNNTTVIDYIYHRATDTWWRLKDGYDSVIATINPGIEFVQLNSLEYLAVNLLIAENANIAGFVFKDGKMISQKPSTTNPNVVLDGTNGSVKLLSGDIGIFSIGQGLTYDKTGFRYIENNIYSYQKRFSLGTSGLQFVNNDVYSGVWCLQNELGQDMCSNKNTHRLDYTIETGDVDYALKIIASGAYQYNSYKGLIWLQAVASSIPAILLEKGGMYMKKGDLTIEEGTIVIDNKRGWSGTFKDQTGKNVTVTKGIITNVM